MPRATLSTADGNVKEPTEIMNGLLELVVSEVM
jgi:hypothetical protein